MADRIRRVDYFYVQVPDKAGAGAPVLERLRQAGVNLLAFTAFPTEGGKSQLDFVPENSEAFTRALAGTGLQLSPRKQAFLVRGTDRVGVVADVHGRLAEARINVIAANACASPDGGFGLLLWVSPDCLEAAAKALGAV